MQNLRNKNIQMYRLISAVRATYLYRNKIKIIDMMETIKIYKGTMDKFVLVEGKREREEERETDRCNNKESKRS